MHQLEVASALGDAAWRCCLAMLLLSLGWRWSGDPLAGDVVAAASPTVAGLRVILTHQHHAAPIGLVVGDPAASIPCQHI